MEKSLMERLKNHTLDEIDMDMIAARLKNVHNKLSDVYADISKAMHRLEEIKSEHPEEVQLLGVRIVIAVDDELMHEDAKESNPSGIPLLAIVGNKRDVESILDVMQKVIDS